MTFLLFTLWMAAAAHAGVNAAFCKPLKDLQAQVLSCDQNDYYLDAAIDCLEGLEKDSVKKFGALGLSPLGGTQAKSFEDDNLNLGEAKILLASLLFEAQTRKVEIENYGRNINFPEDFDNPEIVNKDPEKFLAGSDCYHRAGVVMESVLEEMEKHIGELKAAQNALARAQRKLKDAGLNSEDRLKAAHGRPGIGSATVPRPKNTNSDITGTEQDKAKQKTP